MTSSVSNIRENPFASPAIQDLFQVGKNLGIGNCRVFPERLLIFGALQDFPDWYRLVEHLNKSLQEVVSSSSYLTVLSRSRLKRAREPLM